MTVTEQLEKKYPRHIIRYIRQRFGLDAEDTKRDHTILNMSRSDVFKDVLNWNGLLGSYDSVIKDWVLDIYGIDLDEVE